MLGSNMGNMTDNEQDLKINTLENNQLSMAEKLDDLKTTMVAGFKDIKQEFKTMREENDLKYASKLTEKIVYGLVSLIVITVFGAILSQVI